MRRAPVAVDAEAGGERHGRLQREALRDALATLAGEVDRLVREHDERLRRLLVVHLAVGDQVVERAADALVEKRDRRARESDPERVAPGAREGVPLVAADRHGASGHDRRLGREA